MQNINLLHTPFNIIWHWFIPLVYTLFWFQFWLDSTLEFHHPCQLVDNYCCCPSSIDYSKVWKLYLDRSRYCSSWSQTGEPVVWKLRSTSSCENLWFRFEQRSTDRQQHTRPDFKPRTDVSSEFHSWFFYNSVILFYIWKQFIIFRDFMKWKAYGWICILMCKSYFPGRFNWFHGPGGCWRMAIRCWNLRQKMRSLESGRCLVSNL